MQLIHQLSEVKTVSYEDMLLLCNLPGSSQSPEVLYTLIIQHLLVMRRLPVVALLVTQEKADLHTLFQEAEANNTVEVSAPRCLWRLVFESMHVENTCQNFTFTQSQLQFLMSNFHAYNSNLDVICVIHCDI